MRRTLLPLLSAILLLGLASATRAAEDDAKAIITKALKALGGEEKLTKYKAARVKTKGKLNLPGAGELDFIQEISSMQPDKFKDTLELSKDGKKLVTRTLWYNGDTFALERNGEEVKLDEATTKQLKGLFKDASYMSKVARLYPLLKDKGFELSLVGDEKVEGKPAIGVLVKSKGQKDITLYFDKKTGLLAKLQHRSVKEGTDTEITEERIILEYGKTDDIPSAKKILVKHDGEKYLEGEVLEGKFLEKIDDSEFKK